MKSLLRVGGVLWTPSGAFFFDPIDVAVSVKKLVHWLTTGRWDTKGRCWSEDIIEANAGCYRRQCGMSCLANVYHQKKFRFRIRIGSAGVQFATVVRRLTSRTRKLRPSQAHPNAVIPEMIKVRRGRDDRWSLVSGRWGRRIREFLELWKTND